VFLVTGATGFLGRALVERLLQARQPLRELRRPGRGPAPGAGVEVVAGDVRDPGTLAAAVAGCETVLHLAGKAHDLGDPHPEEFRSVNVEGTRNILEASRQAGVRSFVFVSSVKAMGEGGEEFLDETVPPRPLSAYGVSKLEGERLVLETGARTGMRATVLRLPLAYGRGLRGNLAAMLDSVRRGTFPPPPRVRNRRSLVSSADVANAALLAASSPAAAGRTYLVTDGTAYSTRDLYDAMRDALGLPPRRFAVPLGVFRAAAAAGDAAERVTGRPAPFSSAGLEKLFGSAWYSNERIRRELGFRPATTLLEGLRDALAAAAP
jgi:nucleoside-diphosphate-sugar epimerase